MNRFLGKLSRRDSSPASPSDNETTHDDDSPEAALLHELKTFCESNSSPQESQGNEFVHLPRIVELAESSPAAAKEAAYRIRKYLKTPTRVSNHIQYNAIMVMRILADNPGHTFTRNFDTKFVTTIKELLRYGRDWHVQHYLRQYLNTLEGTRLGDEDLQELLQMWAKEKTKGDRSFADRFPQANPANPGYNPQMAPTPPPHPRAQMQAPTAAYPEPGELAARVEEARNSAKLLTQFVQMTPASEIDQNELIKEFIDRCRTSSRLIQSYIHANNPAPDEDTLLTLIECNDEISVALSQQQRAMLKARKARGSTSPHSNSNGNGAINPIMASGARQETSPLIDLDTPAMTDGRISTVRDIHEPYEYQASDFEVENPFADNHATHNTDADRNRANAGQERTVHFPSEHA
ncbi:uncharacterized protein N7484_002450 [Penicillium longicatenatum]|uniref:uncharacterized protein n=1 Tax=Penicillium longicatenatum TaxID=1561947 RepID=UPI00254858C9|nr:uncharacterized protein N7484_002450 [Penicillium longicatenatum]KAJ5658801.1 hypothetical protein N7484_002450 [Penicillium longicatenatum]